MYMYEHVFFHIRLQVRACISKHDFITVVKSVKTSNIRKKEKTNNLFIHLNLCIALALGLVVFIAGIENATENEVCPTTTALCCITNSDVYRLLVKL